MTEISGDDLYPVKPEIDADTIQAYELDALLDQVRKPEGAGSFADVFGPQSPEQRKMLREAMQKQERVAPRESPITSPSLGDTFFGGSNDIPQNVLPSYGLMAGGALGRQLVSDEQQEFLPGFDKARYDSLADTASATKRFGAQRRQFLRDSPDGPRIQDMSTNGLSFAAKRDMRFAKTNEDKNDVLRKYYGREARLLAPVQVGIDEDDKPIYEQVYQKTEQGPVYRLDVYEDFTSFRELIGDVLAANGGNEAAKRRLENLGEFVGAEALGIPTDLATLLPAVMYAAFPAGLQQQLAIQVGAALGRGAATSLANIVGQMADRKAAGLEPLDNLSIIDSIIEGAIGFAGPSAEATVKQVFTGSDGFLSKALQRAAFAGSRKNLPKAVALEIGDLPLPFAAYLDNFGRAITSAALALRPDVGEEVRFRIGSDFRDAIEERVDALRRGSKITNRDVYAIGQYYRQQATIYAKQIAETAGKVDDATKLSAALAAQRGLKATTDGIRNFATAMYDRALASTGARRQKLEGELQETINGRLDQIKELARIAKNRKAIRTEIDGVEGITNPERINDRLQEVLSTLEAITNVDKAAKNPVSGQISGVMDQLHTMQMELNEAARDGAVPEVAEISKLLDTAITEVGDKFTVFGRKAGEFYTGAKETYALLGRAKRAGYIYNALLRGDAAPLENMIGPLSRMNSSKELVQDTINTLHMVLQYDPKKFTEAAFGAQAKTYKDAVKIFRDNMALTFKSQIGADEDPATFLAEFLGKRNGVLVPSDSRNPVFEFLVPSPREREQIIDLALRSRKRAQEADIFEQVADEVLADRGGSSDVAKRFYDRVKEEAGRRPEGAQKFFENAIENWRATNLKGSQRIIPQVQAHFLERLILSAIKKETKYNPDGSAVTEETLDLQQLAKSVKEVQEDPFDEGFLNYVFRQGTNLTGIDDIKNLLNLTKGVAETLGRILPSGGDSIAVGAQAAKVTAPDSNFGTLIKKLFINRAFVNMLLTPVSRERLEKIVKSDKRSERKAAILLNYIRAKTAQYNEEDEPVVEVDGMFFDKSNKMLPNRAKIFDQIDKLQKQVDDNLRGDAGDDDLTEANISPPQVSNTNMNLPPVVQSAPIPQAPTGLNIPTPAAAGGRGIAALPTPATVQQLQQVGLPLFGGTRG